MSVVNPKYFPDIPLLRRNLQACIPHTWWSGTEPYKAQKAVRIPLRAQKNPPELRGNFLPKCISDSKCKILEHNFGKLFGIEIEFEKLACE